MLVHVPTIASLVWHQINIGLFHLKWELYYFMRKITSFTSFWPIIIMLIIMVYLVQFPKLIINSHIRGFLATHTNFKQFQFDYKMFLNFFNRSLIFNGWTNWYYRVIQISLFVFKNTNLDQKNWTVKWQLKNKNKCTNN